MRSGSARAGQPRRWPRCVTSSTGSTAPSASVSGLSGSPSRGRFPGTGSRRRRRCAGRTSRSLRSSLGRCAASHSAPATTRPSPASPRPAVARHRGGGRALSRRRGRDRWRSRRRRQPGRRRPRRGRGVRSHALRGRGAPLSLRREGCWDLEVDGRALARSLGRRAPRTHWRSRPARSRPPGPAGQRRAPRSRRQGARSEGTGALVNALDPDLVVYGGFAPELQEVGRRLRCCLPRRADAASPDSAATDRHLRHGPDASLPGAAERAFDSC